MAFINFLLQGTKMVQMEVDKGEFILLKIKIVADFKNLKFKITVV